MPVSCMSACCWKQTNVFLCLKLCCNLVSWRYILALNNSESFEMWVHFTSSSLLFSIALLVPFRILGSPRDCGTVLSFFLFPSFFLFCLAWNPVPKIYTISRTTFGSPYGQACCSGDNERLQEDWKIQILGSGNFPVYVVKVPFLEFKNLTIPLLIWKQCMASNIWVHFDLYWPIFVENKFSHIFPA